MKTRTRSRKSADLATVPPAKAPARTYASFADLMADLHGLPEPIPGASLTIPSGILPGYDPGQKAYADYLHVVDVLTGTTSSYSDPAAWPMRAIEAPAEAPAEVPQLITVAEYTPVEPPSALGLGDLSPAEKAAWRRWMEALTEDHGDEEKVSA